MNLQEQIKTRIENHKVAIAGISGDVMTDWHRKQTRVIESRIEELEWVLKLIEPPISKALTEPGVETGHQ